MILAQNHLRRLNGNKISVLFFLSLLLFSSCEIFKPARGGGGGSGKDSSKKEKDALRPISGKKVYDPETGTYIEVKEFPVGDMDTIRWTDIPVMKYPPITSEGALVTDINSTQVLDINEIGSEKLSSYNVSIFLPFIGNRFNATDTKIYDNSLWAVNYYAGTKMALNILSEENINLNISVLDTKASSNTVATRLSRNEDLKNAHLIIGPYRRDNITQVASFAKENDIAFVSPHSAAANISSINENYIQVNSTLKSHCEAIMHHVLANYAPEQIVLVSKNKESDLARLNFFYDQYVLEKGVKDTIQLQEMIISDESAGLEEMEYLPFVELEDTTVFIVPSWNENFVYSFLRKIDVSKNEYNHIIVFGMPQWMNFDKIDYSYYEKMHVHITASSYIDPLSDDIILFKNTFFQRYGSIPTLEAYLGYDITLYFGKMLNEYGTKFQYYMEQTPENSLLGRFEFQPIIRPQQSRWELSTIDRFENKYVNILKFEDYKFQLID